MNQLVFPAAFVAGLAALAWVGAGYADGHWLALAVTWLIGLAYVTGALELQRHRRAMATLGEALAMPPADALSPWLARLHPSLRQPVQRRLDGERVALPAPALTPYLVGLLVLLGMVGTFLGMVVTLKGTVAALESTADLQAMRSALAAPVRGLGLAFGTSVAGVCASAMLGLMAALARRERLQAAAALDGHLATTLQRFTRTHRRDEGWRELQAQAAQMPLLVQQVQALMERLALQDEAARARQLDEQARFHREAQAAYVGLAAAVERSLKDSLSEGARLAGATLQPAVDRTLAGLAEQGAAVQAQVGHALRQQAEVTSAEVQAALARAEAGAGERSAALADELAARFGRQAQALVQAVEARQAAQQAGLAAQEAERLSAWMATLQQASAEIREAAQSHTQSTIAEVARLMQSAAEAPRVAAELIGQLRDQVAASVAHDNVLLDERRQLLAALAELQHRLSDRMDHGVASLETAAARSTAGAVEVSALAEVFGQAILRQGDAHDRLVAHLQRVEAALEQAAARSDEQLAYVVAQAREVIDLSLLSQKQILDEMQQLGRRQAALAGEAG